MASKRKVVPPSKLAEEKRICLSWNLDEHLQPFEGLGTENHDEVTTTPNINGATNGVCLEPPYDVDQGKRSTKKEKKIPSRFKKNILLEIENQVSLSKQTRSRSFWPDVCIGPRLFRLYLSRENNGSEKSDGINNGASCVGGKSINLYCKSTVYFVNIVYNGGGDADEHNVQIKMMESDDRVNFDWNDTKNEYCRCIWIGKLVLPLELMQTIFFMVSNKKLLLSLKDVNVLKGDEIFIDVKLLEPKQGTLADEDRQPVRTIDRKSLKSLMLYFFGISGEPATMKIHGNFCFTANEIPALYRHIKGYHEERFKIYTAVDARSCDKWNDSSSLLAENENSTSDSPAERSVIGTSVIENDSSDESLIDDDKKTIDEIAKDITSLEEIDIDEIMRNPVSVLDKNEYYVETLIPTLRQYQYAAVQWMVSRENETEYELGPSEHALWEKIKCVSDKEMVYYNKFTGRACTNLLIQPLPKGGILADEMGLGKTVEVLALISKNKRKERYILRTLENFAPINQCMPKVFHSNGIAEEDTITDQTTSDHTQLHNDLVDNLKQHVITEDFCCYCGKVILVDDQRRQCTDCDHVMHFDCAGTQGRRVQKYYCAICGTKEVIPTHCTLIVSPETIVHQWIEEIQTHVKPGTLKYFLYLGVANDGFIQPSILAEYDIIITTYATLTADFFHVKSQEARTRSLRHRKKYAALPSPLIFLEFWRVCLDEAQMIQCSTSRVAEMALEIRAVHRWCVTGTPVQRGLEDVYGMLLFTGFFPYCMKTWWKKLLYEPLREGNTKPLFDALSRVMWRTEKKDVLDQINLPKQTETLKMLEFSPIEWQFYKRQEELCTANALTEINKWEETEKILSSLDRSSLHSLLAPLLRLRQACCHPRAVRDGVLGIQKSHLTMDKLLEGLKAKAKLECEEAHRQLMCALNGLAGIDMIENKLADAIDTYREAVQSWAAHKDIFRTDLLQKLHTIKNLSSTLKLTPNCSHALSDDTLEQEASELAMEYMSKSELQVKSTQEKLAAVDIDLNAAKEEVNRKSPWWMEVFKFYRTSNNEDELVTKVRMELRSQLSTTMFMNTKFKTVDGLQYLLISKINKLEDLRDKLKRFLLDLQKEPSREMIITTAACCLRRIEGSKAPRCPFCKADDIFTEYENTIFGHRGMKKSGNVDPDENKRFGGLRAATELDVVLKVINSMARQASFDNQCRDQAKAHLYFMDLLKQEFKCLRNLWFALHKRISAHDELEMSVIRMRLRYDDEKATDSYIIERHEIASQRLKLQGDKAVALHQLSKKKGQLFYLKNLEKAQSSVNGNNPELCPICKDSLGKQWAVFSCGHCYCCSCTTQLEQRRPGVHFHRRKGIRIECPMCRHPTLSEDVSFVVMKDSKMEADTEIVVKGNYSVKIEAIVRKVLEIGESDPDGKILVFSTWQDVLSIIAQALAENDVIFRYGVGSKRKFHDCLTDFKLLPNVKALLMPLQLGSKGLNIIEATHVILTEPSLNPANELQAIGRVHRIGQTKQTFVHRFIVKDTVEERIYNLLKTKSESEWINNNETAGSSLTIRDLANLLTERTRHHAEPFLNM